MMRLETVNIKNSNTNCLKIIKLFSAAEEFDESAYTDVDILGKFQLTET